jgi:hypothetical protein
MSWAQILEDEGVYSEVQLGEYDLGLIPFEDDVLSMEMAESYREVELAVSIQSIRYCTPAAVCLPGRNINNSVRLGSLPAAHSPEEVAGD